MSDAYEGPGWWMASDGRWYPPADAVAGIATETAAPAKTSPEAVLDLRGPQPVVDLRESDGAAALAAVPEIGEAVEVRTEAGGASKRDIEVLDGLSHVTAEDTSPRELVLVEPPATQPGATDGSGANSGNRPVPAAPRPGGALLAVAVVLALLSGLLATLLVRERTTSSDLRAELAVEAQVDAERTAETDDLASQVDTLTAANANLTRELLEASALVPPVPQGRLAEMDVPFDASLVVEERGRFFAVDEEGNYAVWSDGIRTALTDSGVLGGLPIGAFGARDEVWVATDAGTVEVISLIGEDDGVSIVTGPISHIVRDGRAFWVYAPESNELIRFRQSNGRTTSTVAMPVPLLEIVVGAGAVWGLAEDGVVYRVNTVDFTVSAIDAGPDIISLAAGPDALWTLSAADGSLRRIDAVTGQVLVTVPVGRDPIDAEFSTNAIWVVLRSGATLIEVDTRTSAVVSRTPLPSEPTRLHEGQNGVFVELASGVLVRVGSADESIEDDALSGSADGDE